MITIAILLFYHMQNVLLFLWITKEQEWSCCDMVDRRTRMWKWISYVLRKWSFSYYQELVSYMEWLWLGSGNNLIQFTPNFFCYCINNLFFSHFCRHQILYLLTNQLGQVLVTLLTTATFDTMKPALAMIYTISCRWLHKSSLFYHVYKQDLLIHFTTIAGVFQGAS